MLNCIESRKPAWPANGWITPRSLLVHEAYLRLLGQHHFDWSCRSQILGLEARNAQKRGGGFRVPLDDQLELIESGSLDIQCRDLALTRLEEIDERQVRVVELRFFSGDCP